MDTTPQSPGGDDPPFSSFRREDELWLSLTEHLSRSDIGSRNRAAEAIGYMLAYARQTHARMLARAEDRENGTYRLLFSFQSRTDQADFIALIRLNDATARSPEEIGVPGRHEIRSAYEFEFVLPMDIVALVLDIAEAIAGRDPDARVQ